MYWDGYKWMCSNYGDPWCYLTSLGGHPGSDRNIIRRWTAPESGSIRITGSAHKENGESWNNADGVNFIIQHIQHNSGPYLWSEYAPYSDTNAARFLTKNALERAISRECYRVVKHQVDRLPGANGARAPCSQPGSCRKRRRRTFLN